MGCAKIEFKKCHRHENMRCGGNICHFLFLYIIWSTPLTRKYVDQYINIIYISLNINIWYMINIFQRKKDPKVIFCKCVSYNSNVSKASSSALEQCRDRGVWIQNWAERVSRSAIFVLDRKDMGLHHPPLICCFLMFLGDFHSWKGGVS